MTAETGSLSHRSGAVGIQKPTVTVAMSLLTMSLSLSVPTNVLPCRTYHCAWLIYIKANQLGQMIGVSMPESENG
jgi:hypothetical protein